MTWIKPGSSGGCIDQIGGPKGNSFVFTDENDALRLAHSKSWFSRGRELLEGNHYEDALVCFKQAKRLGHPKSVEAIFICQSKLGLTQPPNA